MALIERLAVLVTADAQGAVREFQKLSGEAAKTDTNLTGVQKASGALKGALGAIGIAGAAAAIGKFAGESLQAASALEEVQSKAEVVFGSSFGQVERFATETASALNLSERAAYEAASQFGMMFKVAGFAGDDLARMSSSATALAADLESFGNLAPGEGIQKLVSGLSGESEPLRAVGVFLTEAKVKAEAYSSGIAKVGSELTESEKIQARWNIILRETVDAQGDSVRTADSYANKQRDLAEATEEAKASLGELLKEPAGSATNVFADLLNGLVEYEDAVNRIKAEAGGEDITSIFDIWDKWSGLVDSWFGKSDQAGDKAADFASEMYGVADATAAASGPTGEAAAATKGLVDRLGEVQGAVGPAAEALDAEWNSTADDVRLKSEAAADRVNALKDALTAMETPVLDMRDAQREYESAIDDLTQSIQENGTTLDITAEAGRNNQAALDGVASAAWSILDAFARTNPTAGEMTAKMEEVRGGVVVAAEALGIGADAANAYADELGLVPGNVTTYIQAYGLWETLGALERVNYLLSLVGAKNVWQAGYTLTGNGPGFRAAGGPVGPGSYIVGENGPELLTLRGTSGQVYSNAKTRAMNGGTGDTYITIENLQPAGYDDFMADIEWRQRVSSLPGVRR